MNPELKAAWLTALRSGEYKQGHNLLRRDKNNTTVICCLGVLCDISHSGQWDEYNWYWINGIRSQTILPAPLQDIAHISLETADLLAVMNDSGKSFAEIADYIEANL